MQIDYIASKCMPTFCNCINIYGFLIIFDEGLIRPEKKVTEQFLGLTGKVIYQLLQCHSIHAHMSYKCIQLDSILTMLCRNLEKIDLLF